MAGMDHILGFEAPAQRNDQTAYAAVLTAGTQFTPLLMGLLGVFAFGHEYRYGTIRTALCVLPRRTTLAAAKVLARVPLGAADGPCQSGQVLASSNP